MGKGCSDTTPVKSHLLRILGAGFGLAVILGAAVGGEILRLPGAVAQLLPSPGLFFLAWALGGAFAGVSALSFAELGTRLPRSGGLTVFAGAALGPFAGFVVGWGDFLASAFTVSAFALVLGELAAAMGLPGPARCWGALAILLLGMLQWSGLRLGALVQDLTSAGKGVLLLALGLCALFLPGAPPGPRPPAAEGAGGWLAFAGAMQLVVFAYDNYYSSVYFGEEYTDPRSQIPRSLASGVLLVTGLYLTISWAMVHALPYAALTSDLPGRDLAALVAGAFGARLVRAVMLMALLSAMNATLLIASRVLYALGAAGLAGEGATAVNAGGTPTNGLLATLALALAGLALPGFETAIAFMSPFVLINYALCFLSLVVLRGRDPDPGGIFRAPLFPWTPGLSLLASLALLAGSFAADGRVALGSVGLLVLAWPLFHWVRRAGTAPADAVPEPDQG
jgi:APA family basic amino acid/polyamine antiporter